MLNTFKMLNVVPKVEFTSNVDTIERIIKNINSKNDAFLATKIGNKLVVSKKKDIRISTSSQF